MPPNSQMEEIQPLSPTTRVISTPTDWAWKPDSVENCLVELEHASTVLSGSDRVALFRGQRDESWLLDSTIARNLKQNWFRVPNGHQFSQGAQNTFELHRLLVSAVLWKFGNVIGPHPDLLAHEQTDQQVDSWFELMKRLQQHPEREPDWEGLPGTPLVDWSLSPDIGLFFANRRRTPSQSGAVFIVDTTEIGPIQMTIKVANILQILERTLPERPPGLPLLFCPPKQTKMLRANRQSARYFMHMDLRYDLSAIWRIHEETIGKRILLKLILPAGTDAAIKNYLDQKGIDESYVMVDED